MFKKYFFTLILISNLFSAGGVHLNADQFSLIWLVPFLGILLSIAFLPLISSSFWHHNYGKVSLFWGLLFLMSFSINFPGSTIFYILEVYLKEFIPFIVLLLALFTVSGGILISGNLNGSPFLNLCILIIGTVLASIMGTTGASMLLIRPLIRANSWRKNKTHLIVFFIFLVSNIGGSLSPIGDPPLFLGFLKGVYFTWPLFNMYQPMILVSTILLTLFYFIDNYFYKKESENVPEKEDFSLKIDGKINFLFIGIIIFAVILSGQTFLQKSVKFLEYMNIEMMSVGILMQLIVLLTVTYISLKITPKSVRKKNGFTWEPIKEVAKLFATIFLTMVPAIEMLKGVKNSTGPMSWMKDVLIKDENNIDYMYYWLTGILSSFLDNAPTYVVFFTTAGGEDVTELIGDGNTLLAISCGAVFMGAMTYIGNAPNFMVKSIAEENKINMPSFFGFMTWSIVILIPIFIVVSFCFFN